MQPLHVNVTCVYCRDPRAIRCLDAGQAICLLHVTCVTCLADYVRPGTRGPLHANACLLNVPIKRSAADYVISLCSTEHLKTKKFVIKNLS